MADPSGLHGQAVSGERGKEIANTQSVMTAGQVCVLRWVYREG